MRAPTVTGGVLNFDGKTPGRRVVVLHAYAVLNEKRIRFVVVVVGRTYVRNTAVYERAWKLMKYSPATLRTTRERGGGGGDLL